MGLKMRLRVEAGH